MEQRQDNQETQLRDLAAVVGRVELNQAHGIVVADLRFTAIDSAMKTQHATLTAFIARFEGLLSGEVKTNLTNAYDNFRIDTEARLDAIEKRATRNDAKSAGVFAAFTGAKAVILMLAAIASPLIAAVAIIVSRP